MPKYDLAGMSVMLAMPAHRDLPVPTVVSLIATADLMNQRGIPFEIQLQVGGSIIEWARSKCAHLFLKSDKTRLFWVDSDIAWKADDFLRLLALSTKYECVGGVYPAKQDETTFYLSLESNRLASNVDGLLSVKGLGLGFTVVQRHVIEKLSERAPKLKMPFGEIIPHMFRCDSVDGEFRGEDMAFFADVRALGYDVFLDPAITLGHVGSKTYTASIMDSLKQEQAA